MAKIYREGFSLVWPGERSWDGSECQPIVNIIFIHGLRGHPKDTWATPAEYIQSGDGKTAKNNHGIRSFFRMNTKRSEVHRTEPRNNQTVFWIEDFLPKDIPNARILTYGYNANVIGGLFQANNQNSISQHGRDLKAKLERDTDNEAPIIFVAHSLGGIIAKDALHRSMSTRQRTKLIVFLGTPHRGSSSADWGQIASNMARLALQDSNKKILETLEVNNEVLDNIQETFKTIAYEDGLIVHSFQEARGISGMKGLHNKVVDEFSSKVDLPSAQETVETIDANHMQMTKYRSKDDSGYRDVSKVLKAYIERHLKPPQVVPAEVPLSFSTLRSYTVPLLNPKVHFMVPFQRNGDFIGREEYIKSLEAKLCVPNKYCRVALVGLGGIGKTRIALEYASKHEKSDSMSVFWVHASTAQRMEKDYQEIAKEARLVGAADAEVDQLQLVKQWLEDEQSGNWVMVIDNADDEKLFFGEDENRGQDLFSSSSKLARHFPRRSNGSILLTTRNRKLGVKFAGSKMTTVGGVITIPAMSVSESKSLFLEKLEDDNHDDKDLAELVEILENIPLALVQAASFIAENSQSIGEYLQTYRESDSSKIKLLSQNFEDDERDLDMKNPVAVTWAISFEQIKRNDPQAAELLSFMSIFDKQAIPRQLLSSNREEVELEKALGTLKAFSLITVEQSRQAFNLHRLVYLTTRSWLNMNKELEFWTGKTLVLLSEIFPLPQFENQETWMAYLPHAHNVLNSNHLPAGEYIAQATLLFKVAQALERKGDFDSAEMMARTSLDLREKILGEKNPETLRSLTKLGSVLWRQGRYKEAEEISRQALNGLEETLGQEHVYTLASLSNLALILDGQGKKTEAEKLHRQALNSREKLLGKEHPDTLQSVNNLAIMLQGQERDGEAEKLHRQALSSGEKMLGKEHPNTLYTVNNLAAILQRQGRYEEAEKLQRRALSGCEKMLGKEHPETLHCIDNLAVMLQNQGEFEEAEKLHQQALSGSEKKLGKKHPSTLKSVNNLANLLARQGRYEEAENLHRQALSGRENKLGKEHPDTLQSVRNLARVLAKDENLHHRQLGPNDFAPQLDWALV